MVGLGSCRVLREEGWREIFTGVDMQDSWMLRDSGDVEVQKSCLIIRIHEPAELRTWDRRI